MDKKNFCPAPLTCQNIKDVWYIDATSFFFSCFFYAKTSFIFPFLSIMIDDCWCLRFYVFGVVGCCLYLYRIELLTMLVGLVLVDRPLLHHYQNCRQEELESSNSDEICSGSVLDTKHKHILLLAFAWCTKYFRILLLLVFISHSKIYKLKSEHHCNNFFQRKHMRKRQESLFKLTEHFIYSLLVLTSTELNICD